METFLSCIFAVLYCMCVLALSVCAICKCNIVACALTHTSHFVSLCTSDGCHCGTRCTITRWAGFIWQLPSPDVFWITEGSALWGGGARPRTCRSPSYSARRLLEQGKISDTPHCSFSHITALDSCMLRIFICFVLWRKHWATCFLIGELDINRQGRFAILRD